MVNLSDVELNIILRAGHCPQCGHLWVVHQLRFDNIWWGHDWVCEMPDCKCEVMV